VTVVLVALAGAGGVLLRYGISTGFHGDALPWATVAINVLGSFLLGLLVVAHWASPQTRTALGVGFLGGFTTFSTYIIEIQRSVTSGEPQTGLAYLALTLVAAFLAVYAGARVTRLLRRYVGRPGRRQEPEAQ